MTRRAKTDIIYYIMKATLEVLGDPRELRVRERALNPFPVVEIEKNPDERYTHLVRIWVEKGGKMQTFVICLNWKGKVSVMDEAMFTAKPRPIDDLI